MIMKRILILGSAHSSYEVVKQANQLGYYTIVVSNAPGEASEIANEFVQIDLKEKSVLINYIKENKIDGIFTGPSEFLTKTMIDLCEASGLRCYASSEQWDICQNKRAFKDLCLKFGVPCVPDFKVKEEPLPEEISKIQFPVIVKPVDSHSSRGIRVCQNEQELRDAIPYGNAYFDDIISGNYEYFNHFVDNEKKDSQSRNNSRGSYVKTTPFGKGYGEDDSNNLAYIKIWFYPIIILCAALIAFVTYILFAYL